MNLVATSALAAAALGLCLLFGWLGARPATPMTAPRLIPWRALMLAVFVVLLALLVHLLALARGG